MEAKTDVKVTEIRIGIVTGIETEIGIETMKRRKIAIETETEIRIETGVREVVAEIETRRSVAVVIMNVVTVTVVNGVVVGIVVKKNESSRGVCQRALFVSHLISGNKNGITLNTLMTCKFDHLLEQM